MSTNQVRDGARRSSPPSRRGWAAVFAAPEFYRERRSDGALGRFERIFEPTVLLLAIALFSLGMVQFGLAVAPGWAAEGLVPVVTLAALVAYTYSSRLERATVFWREWLVLLVPFVLVVRVLPYATHGWDLTTDVQTWIGQPLAFFDVGFVFSALLLVGAWTTAFFSTQDLCDVRVQRGELPDLPARTIIERAWESDRTRTIDHTTPFRRLIGRFLQGGLVLIVAAALTAANVRQVVSFDAALGLLAVQHPSSALALVDVLAYWVAVLLLMVEAQYVRTRTLWTLDRVPISAGIAGRWATAGISLVVLGLVAALLAPTEGLLGIGEIVHYGLLLVFALAAYAMAAFYLIFWLVTLPLRWLFGDGSESPAPAAVFAPPPTPPVSEGGSFFDLVKSVLFWAAFAAFVAYALVALWRQGTLHRFIPGLGWLGAAVVRLIGALWAAVRAALGAALRSAAAIAELIRPAVSRGAARGRLGFWRDVLPAGDPRRAVIATYTLIAARAAQRGIVRPGGETASEYRLRLKTAVPGAAPEVDELTETFLRARYAPAPVSAQDVSAARRCWRRIREALRSPRG